LDNIFILQSLDKATLAFNCLWAYNAYVSQHIPLTHAL